MEYLFGVDGGGSGCRVAISDNKGNLIARAEGGPANIETAFNEAKTNILSTCKKAILLAGLPTNIISTSYAVLGLAGSNMGDFDKALHSQLPFKDNQIVNDSEITLEGAIGSSDGCIAAIGTGSVYAGRKNGKFKQLGGWGFLLGDDGSAAKLGRELLRYSILCHENLERHSDLTVAIMDSYQNKIVNVVKKAIDFKPTDFGQFAPILFEYYHKKDPIAIKIINSEIPLIEKSIIAAGFDAGKPFCLLGGLGKFYISLISRNFADCTVPPQGDALNGAIRLAIKNFT